MAQRRVSGRRGAKRDAGRERTWRRLLGEQRMSGVSVRAFCRMRDLADSTFHFWRAELERRTAERRERRQAAGGSATACSMDRPRFLPVTIADVEGPFTVEASQEPPAQPSNSPSANRPPSASLASTALELVHPGGVVVRVPVGCDAAALRTVLQVLDERRGEVEPC